LILSGEPLDGSTQYSKSYSSPPPLDIKRKPPVTVPPRFRGMGGPFQEQSFVTTSEMAIDRKIKAADVPKMPGLSQRQQTLIEAKKASWQSQRADYNSSSWGQKQQRDIGSGVADTQKPIRHDLLARKSDSVGRLNGIL
jgi:hypothetical protein